jgi:hypothetical protein
MRENFSDRALECLESYLTRMSWPESGMFGKVSIHSICIQNSRSLVNASWALSILNPRVNVFKIGSIIGNTAQLASRWPIVYCHWLEIHWRCGLKVLNTYSH